jgi:hypothetical protein
VHVGDLGELGTPWIDHHQPGILPDEPLQPGTDHRVRLRRIRPDEQDAIGSVEVIERSGPPG